MKVKLEMDEVIKIVVAAIATELSISSKTLVMSPDEISRFLSIKPFEFEIKKD